MSHLHRRRTENWVLSNTLESEIARGNIDGMSEFLGFGERQVITSGIFTDLWGGTATAQPWPNQTGGEQMMILSSDHDDRLTGTGVQKIEIDYLDAIGNEQYEILNMNGTAFVRTVGTNIRFINAIHTTQVGSGTVASGDISVCTNGTIATVYNMISVGGNMSLSTQRMIPYGKTFYLHEWSSSCAAVNDTTRGRVRLRSTTIHGTRIERIFLFTDISELNNSTYNKIFHVPKKIPQLCVIKADTLTNANASVSVSYSGCIEDNE